MTISIEEKSPVIYLEKEAYASNDIVNLEELTIPCNSPLDKTYYHKVKRVFDFVIVIFSILFLFPLFAVIALLIKLDSSGGSYFCTRTNWF